MRNRTWPATSLLETFLQASYAAERGGRIAEALQQAQSALAQARAAGPSEALAEALACLAYMQNRLGHHDQARVLAEEALTYAPALSSARARAGKVLGDCAHENGDLPYPGGQPHGLTMGRRRPPGSAPEAVL